MILALLGIGSAWAYDFSAVAPTGQTLYYNINGNSVTVTSQNSISPYYSTYPTGALTIPASVTHNSQTYPVTSIGEIAFWSCSGLTSVTIPNSVTSIGIGAFCGCSGLTEITSLARVAPTLGMRAFYGVASDIPVNIPCGSLDFYQSEWSEYFSNFIDCGAIEGINEAENASYTIRTMADRIVVEGINNETVRLFDCTGRCLQTLDAVEGCTLQAPAAGVYLLQIGNNPAQKVVVLK